MYYLVLPIVLLIVGLVGVILGIKILFQEGFAERFQKGFWKTPRILFSENDAYQYTKYVTGTQAFLLGSIFTGFAVYLLLHMYGYL